MESIKIIFQSNFNAVRIIGILGYLVHRTEQTKINLGFSLQLFSCTQLAKFCCKIIYCGNFYVGVFPNSVFFYLSQLIIPNFSTAFCNIALCMFIIMLFIYFIHPFTVDIVYDDVNGCAVLLDHGLNRINRLWHHD